MWGLEAAIQRTIAPLQAAIGDLRVEIKAEIREFKRENVEQHALVGKEIEKLRTDIAAGDHELHGRINGLDRRIWWFVISVAGSLIMILLGTTGFLIVRALTRSGVL
jgi:hypothetical protein